MDTKNKSRGRPKVDTERICSRMERDLLSGIDAASGDEQDDPSRPEMLRRIVKDWLIGRGYLEAD